MGGLHLEALYPAVVALVLGVLAVFKKTSKAGDDDTDEAVNIKTLVQALGAAEAGRQDEQAARMTERDARLTAERELATERALREACEERENRPGPRKRPR